MGNDAQPADDPAALAGAVLSTNPITGPLGVDGLESFMAYLEPATVPAGTTMVREGESGGDMYFVLEGRALLQRKHVRLTELGPGAHFGELGLLSGRPRAASVFAATPLVLARLTRDRLEAMASEQPAVALAFLRRVIASLGQELAEMTDSVGLLLKERSLPRRTVVEVTIGDDVRLVRTGTPLAELLPAEVDGKLVVAALLDRKAVSLNTPVSSDTTLAPLTTAHWEGRRIYRRSVGLLLLEAAARFDPTLDVRLGPSVGFGQVVDISGREDLPRDKLAAALTAEMRHLAEEDALIHTEWWTVEEATSHLLEQGWRSSATLLKTWRDAAVPMVTCGHIYSPSLGPLVPRTRLLKGFALVAHPQGLRLYFDEDDLQGGMAQAALNGVHRTPGPGNDEESDMDRSHQQWLKVLAVHSVGAFNDLCISGQVSQLIRVAEGFHEKHIGQIADDIARRRDDIRIICIAGPSSSGKTTFIKRLTVQLQVAGVNPVGISLDNYYVDREKTVKDDKGEYDFEALEALDLPLLQEQLGRLLAGEAVTTPRYDFPRGRSVPGGGPRIELRPGDVLMLEGIHGLNPRLLGPVAAGKQRYRIFINPTTALPFDRLWRVSVSDVRLLRRIVRDRHHRGYSAAEGIMRWPSVRAGERVHILPFRAQADAIFDSSLVYEVAVLKVYADRYLLEVPHDHPAYTTAQRLRQLVDRFVTVYPDQVPSTSILREFIGGSGFEY